MQITIKHNLYAVYFYKLSSMNGFFTELTYLKCFTHVNEEISSQWNNYYSDGIHYLIQSLVTFKMSIFDSDESLHSLEEESNSDNVPDDCTDERAIEEVQKLNTCLKESLKTSSYNEGIDEYTQYNFNSITLLENLQRELSECNTQFISDYLKVLTSNDKTNISCVTDNVRYF